jgi:hypothetical protein
MAMMLVQCPETGNTISTEVDIDSFSFLTLGTAPLSIRKCPACGSVHHMTTRDAWLDEAPARKSATEEQRELEVEAHLAG